MVSQFFPLSKFLTAPHLCALRRHEILVLLQRSVKESELSVAKIVVLTYKGKGKMNSTVMTHEVRTINHGLVVTNVYRKIQENICITMLVSGPDCLESSF